MVDVSTFANIGKVTNYSERGDDQLAWYSPSVTCQIYIYGLEHSLKINSLKYTCFSLIVEVLSTRTKFLKPPAYCTEILPSQMGL